MDEYIDREKMIADLEEELEYESGMYTKEQNDFLNTGLRIALKDVKHMRCEDVVPVVRCSQCRKRYTTECALWFSQLDDKQYFCGAIHNDDFYCSYGERKD